MRPGRAVLVVWSVVVGVLVILEVAEVTRVFTVPIARAVADPLVLLVSLLFTTVIAVVGAIFVGISMSARLLNPRGFTPFEEEMLRMRADLLEVKRSVEEVLRREGASPPTAPPRDPPRPGDRR